MRHSPPKLALLAALVLLLNGCAILRELGPAVEVEALTPGEYIALKRGDILTSGTFSAATMETISVAGLDGDGPCASPATRACLEALADTAGLSHERRLSALSELWVKQAQALPAAAMDGAVYTDDSRLDAWLEVARHAYAYLFFSERASSARAFEDRQTQVRDYYNLAVQEATSLLFARQRREEATLREDAAMEESLLRQGGWTFHLDLSGLHTSGAPAIPQDLVPASSLSFSGLRSTYRRDGFGAELVAVKADDPLTVMADAEDASDEGSERPRRRSRPVWSEMPARAITVLLCFSGDSLEQVMTTKEAWLSAYDAYQHATIRVQDQDVPLAANITAAYGLWLARSDFNRQSLLSLFGREQGIDRPHLYLMQPYDPKRRVILMIHGLASSPEAWVNVANELMGDEGVRRHFQIWQIYYPTNMPIALNHLAIRQTLDSALRHLDPQGTATASRDMVLIGHSMGGLISRLMVSSSGGDALWDRLLDGRELDDGRMQRLRRRIGPMLHFEPTPQVGRAVFIAAPHRGTEIAGSWFGRGFGRLVRLPLTMLESFGDVLQHLDGDGDDPRDLRRQPPNSIDNLDQDNPFVRAAADLPVSPRVRYHSIIARRDPEVPLTTSSDGLVPYWSAHLDGAVSEKVVHSEHSVQETAPAIIEMRRILHEDIRGQSAVLEGGDNDPGTDDPAQPPDSSVRCRR